MNLNLLLLYAAQTINEGMWGGDSFTEIAFLHHIRTDSHDKTKY
jgi:hypothetical protein